MDKEKDILTSENTSVSISRESVDKFIDMNNKLCYKSGYLDGLSTACLIFGGVGLAAILIGGAANACSKVVGKIKEANSKVIVVKENANDGDETAI